MERDQEAVAWHWLLSLPRLPWEQSTRLHYELTLAGIVTPHPEIWALDGMPVAAG